MGLIKSKQIELNIEDKYCKQFISEFSQLKLRLSGLNGVILTKIQGKNSNLCSFMENCIPLSLKNLILNEGSISD